MADEVRYFCMSRPVKPVVTETAPEQDNLSLFLDIPKQGRTATVKRPRMEVINE